MVIVNTTGPWYQAGIKALTNGGLPVGPLSISLDSIAYALNTDDLDQLSLIVNDSPFKDDIISDLRMCLQNVEYLLRQVDLGGFVHDSSWSA
jgi:hypothetical protein